MEDIYIFKLETFHNLIEVKTIFFLHFLSVCLSVFMLFLEMAKCTYLQFTLLYFGNIPSTFSVCFIAIMNFILILFDKIAILDCFIKLKLLAFQYRHIYR